MKKIFISMLMAFLFCGCIKVISSNENIILPLFSTKSSLENKAWIGTFQLVFNDMKNNIIKNNVYFENESPTDELTGLNNEEFNSSMLNEDSYYKSYGKTSPKAKEEIKKGIKEKFNETSEIIDKLDWQEGKGKYYAYAMLKKEFEFITAFDKLKDSKFNNSNKKYQFFGINDDSSKILDKNVRVLFYNNSNDYAVSLITKTGDIIYLYRTDENSDFKNIYQKLTEKSANYKGNRKFQEIDTLKVPNLKFKKMRSYNELCGKRIKGTDMTFSTAIETLQFELNNKGGKVKSEAIIMTDNAVAIAKEPIKPRHFNFDKTFVMFLTDKGKDIPYMALRIYDLDEFLN